MKKLIKSEQFIYIIIAALFLGAFLTVYLKTERKLEALEKVSAVIIHDVTTEKADGEKRVYITPSGKKYHLEGCDYLSEKAMAVSLADAQKAEYEACEYCKP